MSVHSKKEQVQALREQGFVVVPGMISPERCGELKQIAQQQLRDAAAPLEFEADLRYPGAPDSKHAPGGHTVRRLLDAYARDPRYREWATAPEIRGWMELYFGEEPRLSRVHHNCMMTKHPAYGSLTGWHRDVRYWSFERDDLVSVWFALGNETVDNGALWLVPHSHNTTLTSNRFGRREVFPLGPAGKPGADSDRGVTGIEGGGRRVLSLQHAAFRRQEHHRRRQVFARIYLSWREQYAVAGFAFGVEA